MAAGPLLVLVLAACGSNSTPRITGGGGTPTPAQSAGAPGVVGMVAAVSGGSLQVQNPSSGQVTVDFGAGTRIVEQQSAALSAVKVGQCLTVSGTPAADGAGVTGRTVTISTASGGSCMQERAGLGGGGFGGGGRGGRSAAPRPSASARDNATVSGTVTAVSGSTVTVSGVIRTGGSRPSATPAARPVRVVVDAATRFTNLVVVPSSALKVGQCVAAVGTSNDMGAVQATTISIFQAGQNGCAFGRGPGAGRSAGAGGNG